MNHGRRRQIPEIGPGVRALQQRREVHARPLLPALQVGRGESDRHCFAAGRRADRVPLGTLLIYGLPGFVLHFTFMLVLVYLMKYATDVLLVPAAVMGMLFGLSRVSDAILDPAAGYLSDRTRSRLGRRRSWMLASSLPMGATFFMLWSPPTDLTGISLSIWMGVAVFAYHVATTMFAVPHEALGAELSTSYHDRTRIFGVKHIVGALGRPRGAGRHGAAATRRRAPPRGVRDRARIGPRSLRPRCSRWCACASAPRTRGAARSNPWRAFADVWRNPHATAAAPRIRDRELRHRGACPS